MFAVILLQTRHCVSLLSASLLPSIDVRGHTVFAANLPQEKTLSSSGVEASLLLSINVGGYTVFVANMPQDKTLCSSAVEASLLQLPKNNDLRSSSDQ